MISNLAICCLNITIWSSLWNILTKICHNSKAPSGTSMYLFNKHTLIKLAYLLYLIKTLISIKRATTLSYSLGKELLHMKPIKLYWIELNSFPKQNSRLQLLNMGLFIYGAQKFFGYELKNFLAKDEKFFGYKLNFWAQKFLSSSISSKIFWLRAKLFLKPLFIIPNGLKFDQKHFTTLLYLENDK